jgi:hypothetical protein
VFLSALPADVATATIKKHVHHCECYHRLLISSLLLLLLFAPCFVH